MCDNTVANKGATWLTAYIIYNTRTRTAICEQRSVAGESQPSRRGRTPQAQTIKKQQKLSHSSFRKPYKIKFHLRRSLAQGTLQNISAEIEVLIFISGNNVFTVKIWNSRNGFAETKFRMYCQMLGMEEVAKYAGRVMKSDYGSVARLGSNVIQNYPVNVNKC